MCDGRAGRCHPFAGCGDAGNYEYACRRRQSAGAVTLTAASTADMPVGAASPAKPAVAVTPTAAATTAAPAGEARLVLCHIRTRAGRCGYAGWCGVAGGTGCCGDAGRAGRCGVGWCGDADVCGTDSKHGSCGDTDDCGTYIS